MLEAQSSKYMNDGQSEVYKFMFLATSSASILVSYHQSKNVGQQHGPCSSALCSWDPSFIRNHQIFFANFLRIFRLHQGLLSIVQPSVSLSMSSDRQASQMPELLQVFCWWSCFVGAYSQTQGVQTCQDPHLCLLWEELYPGELCSGGEVNLLVPPSKGLSLGEREIPEIIFSFNYLQINSRNQAKT